MYHSVGHNSKFSTVSPKEFERQINLLLGSGKKIIRLAEMVSLLQAGSDVDQTVALTFDDGYEDFYSTVFPLLKKYNVPASVFVVTDKIGKEMHTKQGHVFPIVSKDQITEMVASGYVDVLPHTRTHPKLNKISLEESVIEISGSQELLGRMTGKNASILAYPFGKYTAEIVAYLQESPNWTAAVTVEMGYVRKDSLLFTLPRISIDSEVGIQQFKRKVL